MNCKVMINFTGLALALLMTLLLTACSATPSTKPPGQLDPMPVAEEPVEPWDGDGLDIPLDGSSLESFNRSLARVEAHTSATSYTTLVNAIDYLLVYDLAANRDRTRLAANLDGLTGREVINKVRWQK